MTGRGPSRGGPGARVGDAGIGAGSDGTVVLARVKPFLPCTLTPGTANCGVVGGANAEPRRFEIMDGDRDGDPTVTTAVVGSATASLAAMGGPTRNIL